MKASDMRNTVFVATELQPVLGVVSREQAMVPRTFIPSDCNTIEQHNI